MKSRFFRTAAMLMALAILSGCIQPTSEFDSRIPDSAVSNIIVSFEVVDAAGALQDSRMVSVERGSNAWEVMRETYGEENLGFVDYGPGLGALVTSIEGITPPEDYFWKLYVDDAEAYLGISLIELNENITIRWELCRVDELNRECLH